jgi:tol-pal system protein YbgF
MRQDIKGLQDQVRSLRTEVRRPELAAQVKSLDKRQRRSQQALSDRMVEIEGRLGEVSRQMEQLQATTEEATHATDETRKENAALTARLAAAESGMHEASRRAGEQQGQLAPLESHLAAVEAEVDALAKQVTALLTRKTAPPVKKRSKKKKKASKKTSSKTAKGSAKSPAKAVASKTKAKASGVSQVARASYDAALKQIRGGDRKGGIAAMEAFAKANPHTELTDNAYFWIGQGYYAEGEYKKAAFRFEDVLIRFPKSDKAPGALLKEGLSFLALARQGSAEASLDDARMALQQVVHDYPGSSEAKLAKQELAKLKGK